MIFQVDPFPPPSHAGQEIENIGLMAGHLVMLIFLIILMIYLYKKISHILPMIIIYMFSLIFGVICIGSVYMIFSPYFALFFIFFQSSIFLMNGLDEFNKYKRKKRGY